MVVETPFALLLTFVSGMLTNFANNSVAFPITPNATTLGLLLVIFLLTCVSLAGVGLLMAAAILIWKKTDSWRGVVQYSFLFFSGLFGSEFNWPAINAVSTIIPLTWTIRALELVLLDEVTPLQFCYSSSFLGLLLMSTISIAMGYVAFDCAQRYTLKKGTFDQF